MGHKRWRCCQSGGRTFYRSHDPRRSSAGKDTRPAPVASVQCQMTGSDEGSVAQELGRIIGGALGKRVERQAF